MIVPSPSWPGQCPNDLTVMVMVFSPTTVTFTGMVQCLCDGMRLHGVIDCDIPDTVAMMSVTYSRFATLVMVKL